MDKKSNWFSWVSAMIKEFIIESKNKPQYEVVELYECEKTGFTKAIVKLSGRHVIEKNISDIVIDNNFIQCLDKKTIRTLTYMATVETLKPDYSVVVQQLGDEVDDYILEIKSRKNNTSIKKSASDVVKNKSLIAKLSPSDANRVGYLQELEKP